ncbi:efflux RND transporter periplasmic adaptor subunit [Pseudomonas sp. N040]|uniref:efflux RND transporter periplasmic adaptor subunit n=1 Tax=Pseudomonas sp. N040 TaxID=2785325 RepID=UPI0018A24C99|nr:efflux RND transporter periplasmic adaptor subunit [Pseudomonas sp. N040]MBF7728961.1 efflux RND transporter periplasmic adaptor subunit [Pseudomonas sp. N040]MBW7012601.1 efflux RND transporter periplasmic adaptor subunit [Pseudomonas sp. N040]
MRKILIGLLIVACLAALGWWWKRPQPLTVTLVEVGSGPVESLVANSRAGTLKACRRSHLSFKLGGQVSELLIREGQRVAQGQVLMRLRQDDQQARVTEAAANLAASHNAREQRCSQAQLDQRDLDRVQHLAERKLVAEDQLDQAQTRARLAQLLCRASGQRIEQAAANLALQNALLDQTTLRAPFAGIVAEINGELGEYVTPSPPGIPTPPAVDLIDDSCLYVEAPIDEVDAARVTVGLPVRISLDALRGQHFAGKVTRMAPFVRDLEKQARTVDIEARFDQPPAGVDLLTGYSADVEVLLEQRQDVLRIPTESLLDGQRVLRYDDAAGVLREVAVTPGLANWRWTEVGSGLQAGDRIVVSLDQEGLVDGARVRPLDADPAAGTPEPAE